MLFTSFAILAASASLARAITDRSFALRAPLPPPVDAGELHRAADTNGSALPPITTTYYFDQLIDHKDPSKGTFQQRYWTTWNFYKKGGPIVLFTPGEANAQPYTGYLTNRTISGQIAQQEGGATVLLEHRFFGLSNPYPDLSVKSLQYLNLEQSVADLAYFAKNVVLPMPSGDEVTPDKAPWVLVGGSYSGQLTAYTMVANPGLFAAGWASSAVVETIVDFWQYFEPIRENMPKNCSADVQAVVAYFDLVTLNPKAVKALKAQFGMQDVVHYDDVTSTLKNPIYAWQDLQPNTGPGGDFFQFCDALEVKNGKSAPASGWGLTHALSAWGDYFKNTYLPSLCGDSNYNDCLGTYNSSDSFYTSTEVDNANRSWFWFVCNEVGFFQDAAPFLHPTLVSRTLQPINQELRQCQYFFPEQFHGKPPSAASILKTDLTYHGWDLDVPTLFFGNGISDPWRDTTVSAEGIYPPHIPQSHIGLHDGFHTSDLITSNNIDATVLAVQKKGLAFMAKTLAAWK